MHLRALLGVFLFISPVAAIEISEVLYNPDGSDDNHEWVEVHTSSSSFNLSGWKFFVDGGSRSLSLISGSWFLDNASYAVIAEDGVIFLLDYPNFTGTLFDSSTFTLGNSVGEFLALKNTSHYAANMTYDTSLGADDGLSLQLINGSWYAAPPTPGAANALAPPASPPSANTSNVSGKDLSLTVSLEPVVHLLVNYTSLFKITNLGHQTGIDDSINATVSYNLSRNNTLAFASTFEVTDLNSFKTARTGSIFLNETGNYTLCGSIISTTAANYNLSNDFACATIQAVDSNSIPCNASLSIATPSLITNNSETVGFSLTISNESFPYIIEYWIEDLFGRTAKRKVNTSNTNQKSWTPQITESDRAFLIRGRIASLFCNDTSLEDNSASQLLIVRGVQEENSTLMIDTIYTGTDNRVKYGEILRVRSQIYKGDESKNAVEVWVEQQGKRISRIVSASLYTDFSAYDLTFAIPLEQNCDAEHPDGTAEVVLTGFGITERAPVSISGTITSNCRTAARGTSSGSSLLAQRPAAAPLVELLSFSGTADEDTPFSTTIRITNSDDEQHTYAAWSYVYRGPKSYSGERDANLQEATIAPGNSAVIPLTNQVDEPGTFSFKVQVRKDDQKTTYDLTRPIIVAERAPSYLAETVVVQAAGAPSSVLSAISTLQAPERVYLSPASRSQELAGLLIIGMLTSITLYLIWKKP